MSPETHNDLLTMLDLVRGLPRCLDELNLLRVAIRAYAEGREVHDAVAWAADQLSTSIAAT